MKGVDGGELEGQGDGTEACAVQYLVRVGVADAAEEARVGKCALQGVVLGLEDRGELFRRSAQGLDSGGPGRRIEHVDLGAVLGSGLGQGEFAAVKFKCGDGRALAVPVQAAGDHEV